MCIDVKERKKWSGTIFKPKVRILLIGFVSTRFHLSSLSTFGTPYI